jgi:Fe(3+) dicitrate transport protein
LQTRGTIRLLGGSDGYLAPYLEAGTTRGAWGMLVTGLWKRGDGYRDYAQFDVRDAMLKLRRTWGTRTDVTLKGTFYEARTNNTYLGLTQGMFEMNPYQNPARFDTYDVDYYGGVATFRHKPYTTQEYLVNFYVSSGRRDWNRQDFARNTGFAPPPANTVETVGDTTIDGGAIYMRQSFGSRDRDFIKIGIEPRVHGEFWAGGKHEYDAGFRLHAEKYTNERNNRTTMGTAPVTRDRDISRTRAAAAWVHDTFSINRRFRVSAGVRTEYYVTERDLETQGSMPVNFRGDTNTFVLIPGLGVTHDVGREHTAFAGVHRGFAPPRTSDAIDSMGTDLDLDAEKSWNYELGMRGTPKPWLSYEVTGFYMDFQNQVVPANESGGASTTDTNAGETTHIGVEAAASVELVQAFSRSRRHESAPKLWLDASWTWLQTENVTPNGIFYGQELPYAPNHMGSFGLRGQLPRQRVDLGFFAGFTGEQFSDQANTLPASADGTRGVLPSYWLLDATARWRMPGGNTTAVFSVNNILDTAYISSRAPQGVFAGARRHFFAGVEIDL